MPPKRATASRRPRAATALRWRHRGAGTARACPSSRASASPSASSTSVRRRARPLGDEQPRRGGAHAARGAGDDGGLICESIHRVPWPRCTGNNGTAGSQITTASLVREGRGRFRCREDLEQCEDDRGQVHPWRARDKIETGSTLIDARGSGAQNNARCEGIRAASPPLDARQEIDAHECRCCPRERLVSADSHVHFTDEWVKARLPQRLHSVWDDAGQEAGGV